MDWWHKLRNNPLARLGAIVFNDEACRFQFIQWDSLFHRIVVGPAAFTNWWVNYVHEYLYSFIASPSLSFFSTPQADNELGGAIPSHIGALTKLESLQFGTLACEFF